MEQLSRIIPSPEQMIRQGRHLERALPWGRVNVDQRIADAAASLTRSERRVAEVVLADPQIVAFGTVAELAVAASSGAATVLRLAGKLGFDGFSALQAAVQSELARQLRPAVERIRQPAKGDLPTQHLALELDNVQATLTGAGDADVRRAGSLLADLSRDVLVLSGDASRGIGLQLALDLSALRSGVELLDGNEVHVYGRIAELRDADLVVALDLRRYDRWVVQAARRAASAGAEVIALTDSRLSPLAEVAQLTFVVAAGGAGPFDSHVGTLALCNLLVAFVAAELRASATQRLDRAEAEWRAVHALEPGD